MMFATTMANDLWAVAGGALCGAIGVGTWWKLRAGTYSGGRSTAWFGMVVCGVGAVALIGLGAAHLLAGG